MRPSEIAPAIRPKNLFPLKGSLSSSPQLESSPPVITRRRIASLIRAVPLAPTFGVTRNPLIPQHFHALPRTAAPMHLSIRARMRPRVLAPTRPRPEAVKLPRFRAQKL